MIRMAFDTYTLNTLLKEHGTNVTLRKQAESAYNNDTGTITTTDTDYTVRVYFYDFKSEEINSDSILSGDRRVVISSKLANGSATPKPDATDRIISNGDVLDIVRVFDVKSGSKVLFYTAQVRD